LAIGGGSVIDSRSIESIEDHASKCNHYRNYDTHRDDATCKSSVLCLFLIAKHLERIKKISHFYSLFQVFEESHGLLFLAFQIMFNNYMKF
jgi:hypothetical protein